MSAVREVASSLADRYVAGFIAHKGYPLGWSEEKVRAIVSAVEQTPAPGMRWVPYFDLEGLLPLLQRFTRVPEVVDEIGMRNPGQWFADHYCNPFNLVFDVGSGAGFIAFLRTFPGWKAQVYFAAWHRRAMRSHDLWRHAARIAMLAWDLHVIEGFIRIENVKSRRAARRSGMRFRGVIRPLPLYNRPEPPMAWYEVDRVELGLPVDEE